MIETYTLLTHRYDNRSAAEMWNIWYWSVHHQSTTSLGRSCPQNVRKQDSKGYLLRRVAVGHPAQLPTTATLQRQPKSQPTVNGHRPRNLGRPIADNRSKWQKACLTGVQHFEEVRIVTAVETQPTERFYKSVRPLSQVRRYKTLYLWWLRSTIHRKNRPCRSFEDPQEVESETGAHTSSRRETPSIIIIMIIEMVCHYYS